MTESRPRPPPARHGQALRSVPRADAGQVRPLPCPVRLPARPVQRDDRRRETVAAHLRGRVRERRRRHPVREGLARRSGLRRPGGYAPRATRAAAGSAATTGSASRMSTTAGTRATGQADVCSRSRSTTGSASPPSSSRWPGLAMTVFSFISGRKDATRRAEELCHEKLLAEHRVAEQLSAELHALRMEADAVRIPPAVLLGLGAVTDRRRRLPRLHRALAGAGGADPHRHRRRHRGTGPQGPPGPAGEQGPAGEPGARRAGGHPRPTWPPARRRVHLHHRVQPRHPPAERAWRAGTDLHLPRGLAQSLAAAGANPARICVS